MKNYSDLIYHIGSEFSKRRQVSPYPEYSGHVLDYSDDPDLLLLDGPYVIFFNRQEYIGVTFTRGGAFEVQGLGQEDVMPFMLGGKCGN